VSGEVLIRPVTEQDHDAWRVLYRGYRDFYQVEHSDAAIDTVWSWLHDPAQQTRGLIATVDGVPRGLAHYRTFARPLSASHGIYLDDLFTAPEARGHGLGSALLTRLSEIARDEGATVVRWITAESNETARSLYDKVSTRTPWVTYDLAPAAE
jgi:ribosomal protein S18 acetylase RimI-like enzyme